MADADRPSRGGWKIDWDIPGDELHIRPRDDAMWHPLEADCVCGPAHVEADTPNGRVPLHIHRALDGRTEPPPEQG